MYKLVAISNCQYCPHHFYISGDNLNPDCHRCLKFGVDDIHKISEEELAWDFPGWCPLQDAKEDE